VEQDQDKVSSVFLREFFFSEAEGYAQSFNDSAAELWFSI
jgi:hypothetical protein